MTTKLCLHQAKAGQALPGLLFSSFTLYSLSSQLPENRRGFFIQRSRFHSTQPARNSTKERPGWQRGEWTEDDLDRKLRRDSRNKLRTWTTSLATVKQERTMRDLLSFIFTRAVIDLTPPKDTHDVLFVDNYTSRLRVPAMVRHADADDEGEVTMPGLVAFYAPRSPTFKLSYGRRMTKALRQPVPSEHQLVSVVDVTLDEERGTGIDARARCFRYLSHLSQYKPASPVEYGFAVTRTWFQFISLGLDGRATWPMVRWTDPASYQKLYACIGLMLRREKERSHGSIPKLSDIISVRQATVASYTAVVHGHEFTLFPIHTGKSEDGKTFVALSRKNEDQESSRVLKYSWCTEDEIGRERRILEKLADVPGVVRVDENLSTNELDKHDGHTRGLLVLKTVGCPLSSCKTVLEFLEAMYDLLEVHRYLVHEKNILHRDISWGSVFIRPEENPRKISAETTSPSEGTFDVGGEAPKHRFLSNVLGEFQPRVRVALSDFDRAVDMSEEYETLKGEAGVGTPMFMARDLFRVRYGSYMKRFTVGALKRIKTAAIPVNGMYERSADKVIWDEFYAKKLDEIRWKTKVWDEQYARKLIRHEAMHDAESVFYLLVLFLCRAWPSDITREKAEELGRGRSALFEALALKRPGRALREEEFFRGLASLRVRDDKRIDPLVSMLEVMHEYLSIPWYNVEDTAHGERYEFHLHDFMQRLLLKEILRLRTLVDPILLEGNPLPIKMIVDRCISESHPIPSAASLDFRQKEEVHIRNKPKVTKPLPGKPSPNERIVAIRRLRRLDVPTSVNETVTQKHWDILRWWRQTNLWLDTNN